MASKTTTVSMTTTKRSSVSMVACVYIAAKMSSVSMVANKYEVYLWQPQKGQVYQLQR